MGRTTSHHRRPRRHPVKGARTSRRIQQQQQQQQVVSPTTKQQQQRCSRRTLYCPVTRKPVTIRTVSTAVQRAASSGRRHHHHKPPNNTNNTIQWLRCTDATLIRTIRERMILAWKTWETAVVNSNNASLDNNNNNNCCCWKVDIDIDWKDDENNNNKKTRKKNVVNYYTWTDTGRLQYAAWPVLWHRVPDPPKQLGLPTVISNNNNNERLLNEEEEEEDILEHWNVSATQGAASLFRCNSTYTLPTVKIVWKCSGTTYRTRATAWKAAIEIKSRTVAIQRLLAGDYYCVSSSSSSSLGRRRGWLQASKWRFERDGLWIVGQEQGASMDKYYERQRRLQRQENGDWSSSSSEEEEAEEEQEQPLQVKKKKRTATPSGLSYFLQCRRVEYQRERLEELKKKQAVSGAAPTILHQAQELEQANQSKPQSNAAPPPPPQQQQSEPPTIDPSKEKQPGWLTYFTSKCLSATTATTSTAMPTTATTTRTKNIDYFPAPTPAVVTPPTMNSPTITTATTTQLQPCRQLTVPFSAAPAVQTEPCPPTVATETISIVESSAPSTTTTTTTTTTTVVQQEKSCRPRPATAHASTTTTTTKELEQQPPKKKRKNNISFTLRQADKELRLIWKQQLTNEERADWSRRGAAAVVASTAAAAAVESTTTTRPFCLSAEQVTECYDIGVTHFNRVMQTVRARDLQRQLLEQGFDVCRARGRGRYDLEIDEFQQLPFLNKAAPWLPLIRRLLGPRAKLIHQGMFLSLDGAETQSYHQDGPHLHSTIHKPCHAINVFIPLVDLTNQGTEFCLGSHILGEEDWVSEHMYTPTVDAGTPILFDYRLGHRGLANNSGGGSIRPVVYCTYAVNEFRDSVNFSRKRYPRLGDLVEIDRPSRRERLAARRESDGDGDDDL